MKKVMITCAVAASLALPIAVSAAGPSGTLYVTNPATSAPYGHQSTYTNDFGTADQVSAKCDATKGATTNSTNWQTRTNATFADSGDVSGPSYFSSGTMFEGYSMVVHRGYQVYYGTATYQY